ncbi:PepSY domain-containing protein [Halobacillus naozhouensis]|uniref:PepSY domain-containing protein n=1 Tax=Halobacillus naozhouensis TaxID=554880 RepID=A0ABY8IWF4_9BACI|nr:PepSY domain-containing protein [Halobacillus naozhouensis]WFT73677.1 PepSY domain-containing protein [Halobacillus naozhouensis]
MKKKITRILLSLGILTLFTLLVWQILESLTSAEALSVGEAKDQVGSQYEGKVVEVDQTSEEFIFTLERKTGQYEIRIDKKTSEINHMERLTTNQSESIEAKIRKQIEQRYNGEITSFTERKEKEQSRYEVEVKLEHKKMKLTISETGEVIKEQMVTEENQYANQKQEQPLQGTNPPITEEQAQKLALQQVSGTVEDMEYEEEDGQFYYLIDIERGDEAEATVQINAITGEIKLSWDD